MISTGNYGSRRSCSTRKLAVIRPISAYAADAAIYRLSCVTPDR